MGLVCESNFGLGVRVDVPHTVRGNCSVKNYLHINLPERYTYMAIKEGKGSDKEHIYVILKYKLKCGVDNLRSEKDELLKYLADIKVDVLSEFNVWGGLNYW